MIRLDPNPQIFTDDLIGSDISEPFIQLLSFRIDSLTIDGHKLVRVDEVDKNRDDSLTVTCSAEDGTIHAFAYATDGPIAHVIIDNR